MVIVVWRKASPVPGFQLHFHGSELLGEVAGRSLQQSLVTSIATCCPALWAKEMLVPSPLPIFAIASLNASCSIEGRDGQPLLPVRVEHGEFHRDDVASVLNRGHQYVKPLALHLCPSPPRGYSSATTMFPACMGSSSRSFTACPSVRVWSWWMQAATVFFPIALPSAYCRVEAVVSWLAVSPDEVGIAHGLPQSRNGRFPDSLHRHRIRLAVNVALLPGLVRLVPARRSCTLPPARRTFPRVPFGRQRWVWRSVVCSLSVSSATCRFKSSFSSSTAGCFIERA